MQQSTFKPAWWLTNPHLQTVWSTFCRKKINDLPLQQERIELPDGDFVDLSWLGEGDKPLILILHGFEGSINSPYAKGMMQAMAREGFRTVFMHFRGCSGEPNRLDRSYHSGDTADLAAVVDEIRKRYPTLPLGAMGFSLGGNVLLKWLGETGSANPLAAAIAISVPFELKKTALRIQTGFSRVYEWHFLKCLRERLGYKFRLRPPQLNLPSLNTLRTLVEFDDGITAPLHGFESGEEYYRIASCRQYLKTVDKPTLIIHSKDDPFNYTHAIPAAQELSAAIDLEVTEAGGHVGFIGGQYPWQPEYWLEQRAPLFFRNHLQKDLLKVSSEL